MNLSLPGRAVGALLGDIRADLQGTGVGMILFSFYPKRISWTFAKHTNLAGECIGELVRFFSLRMSCGFPPLPSHSTFMSSTFRFWWDDEQSSLKLNAEK